MDRVNLMETSDQNWLESLKVKFLRKFLFLKILPHLNSGVSLLSSSSMLEKTMTISVMIRGQRKVTCTADILRRITLKQRNTALCTNGDTGTVLRHSDSLSVISGIWRWYWSTSEQKMTQASLLSNNARCSCSKSLLVNKLTDWPKLVILVKSSLNVVLSSEWLTGSITKLQFYKHWSYYWFETIINF